MKHKACKSLKKFKDATFQEPYHKMNFIAADYHALIRYGIF